MIRLGDKIQVRGKLATATSNPYYKMIFYFTSSPIQQAEVQFINIQYANGGLSWVPLDVCTLASN